MPALHIHCICGGATYSITHKINDYEKKHGNC
jgi:hypothetical protein